MTSRTTLKLGVSLACLAALLAGCAGSGHRGAVERRSSDANAPASNNGSSSRKGGGYYQDDGPGLNQPSPEDLAKIPDAQPREEGLRAPANKPYTVFGRSYTPQTGLVPFKQKGLASWYGRKFHGRKTSSGERYDMYGMTAAHPTLPIPSYARVTNLENGRSVVVRVNDRGPFHSDRIMDLSFTAAYKLGYTGVGTAMVEVESVLPGQMKGQSVPLAQPTASAPAADDIVGRPLEPATQNVAKSDSAGFDPLKGLSNEPSLKVAAETPPVDRMQPKADGKVYLQLGAFGERGNAEALQERIHKELPWLEDPVRIVLKGSLHRLQLGPYDSVSAAQRIADRIRSGSKLVPVQVNQ